MCIHISIDRQASLLIARTCNAVQYQRMNANKRRDKSQNHKNANGRRASSRICRIVQYTAIVHSIIIRFNVNTRVAIADAAAHVAAYIVFRGGHPNERAIRRAVLEARAQLIRTRTRTCASTCQAVAAPSNIPLQPNKYHSDAAPPRPQWLHRPAICSSKRLRRTLGSRAPVITCRRSSASACSHGTPQCSSRQ